MISYYYLYKDTISKSQSQVFKALFSSVYFQKAFSINCTLLTLLKLFVQIGRRYAQRNSFLKIGFRQRFLFLHQVNVTAQQICVSQRSIQANSFFQIDQCQVFMLHFPFHIGAGNVERSVLPESLRSSYSGCRATHGISPLSVPE